MQRDELESKEKLLAQAADGLEEVTRADPQTVSPEWFTLDLTMPQVRAVFLLLRQSPQRMSSLASTLGVSMSGATGLVDRLVEKQMVVRWTDPEDRRSVLCALTELGKGLGMRLLAERRSRWEERLAPLSLPELKKVCKALELVRDATRKSGAAPAPVASASRRG